MLHNRIRLQGAAFGPVAGNYVPFCMREVDALIALSENIVNEVLPHILKPGYAELEIFQIRLFLHTIDYFNHA